MRVLIATDAWRPQVNGVVRTLTSLARASFRQGVSIEFLTPDGFRSLPLPTYPGMRFALPSRGEIERRIDRAAPNAIHIATEGPIGYMARAYCLRRGLPFTTSYMTRFPEYVAARAPIPQAWSYAALRRFHAPAKVTMVSTPSLMSELTERGFSHLGLWTRGVDTELFKPSDDVDLDLPRPIFMSVGRVAVEKNLEAFLALNLPGSKVVIGDGPDLIDLKQKYPKAVFLGEKLGADLAAHIAAADVFVFPSLTDTFGIVQLEALACGVPVAAYPVTGPRDVIGNSPVGALNHDLRAACIDALQISRDACREFAIGFSWERCAGQFIAHIRTSSTFKSSPARRAASPAGVQI